MPGARTDRWMHKESLSLRAVSISLLLHLLIFVFAAAAGSSVKQKVKPLIIRLYDEGPAVNAAHTVTLKSHVRGVEKKTKLQALEKDRHADTQEPMVQETVSEPPEQKERSESAESVMLTPATEPKTLSQVSGNGNVVARTGSEVHIAGNTAQANAGLSVVHSGNNDASAKAETSRQRYLKEHFAYIKDRIYSNLVYPSMAKKLGWSGRVTVSFVICEDGRVKDMKIVKSSGYEVLDENVLATIEEAQPFPKPPVRAELVLPVSYVLR